MKEHELRLEQHESRLEQHHEFGISIDVVIVVPGKTFEEAIVNMENLSKEEVLKNALIHLPFDGALCC